MSMKVIEHIELASASASLTFSSIPDTYTDLYVLTSTRSTATGIHSLYWRFNNDATGYTVRFLRGNGSNVLSGVNTPAYLQAGYNTPADYTSSTFSNTSLYVPNYLSANPKSVVLDGASENNSTTAFHMLASGIWDIATDAAITSITLFSESGNLAQYTSATLFGITAGSDGTTTVS